MTGIDLTLPAELLVLPAELLVLPAGWPMLLVGLTLAWRRRGGRIWSGIAVPASLGLIVAGGVTAGVFLALVLAFHVAAVMALVFGWRDNRTDRALGMIAAGAGVAALFATTLPGLMIWTEVIALASAVLIMNGTRTGAVRAGLTYLMLQVLAGVLLLIGLIAVDRSTGTLALRPLTLDGIGPWAIFVALLIKAAIVPVHGWLVGAYPQATPGGTLWLSPYATKVAVVGLALLFPGTELLLWLGIAGALLAAIPALLEQDGRRGVAWGLVSQLGVLAIGIGVGTPLAITGVMLLAAGHVVYVSLLFAVTGSLERRDGVSSPGLWLAGLLGALSIGLPGLAGYGGKALIGEALVHQGHDVLEYGVVASGALIFFAIGLRPLFDTLRPKPATNGLSGGETAAFAIALAASLGLGLGAPLFDPTAEALWAGHALVLQLSALGVTILIAVALGQLRRLPGRHDRALAWAMLPLPVTIRWRPDLSRLPALDAVLTIGIGRSGRGLVRLSHRLVSGGAGEGVLWALALLGLGLIGSFA